MDELEDPDGGSDVLGVHVPVRGQRRGDGGRFVAELGLFGGEGFLVNRSGEVGVQEPFLHRLDFGGSLLERQPLLALDLAGIPERGFERLVEPLGQVVLGNPDRLQVSHDGVFEVLASPADSRVIVPWMVVRTAVVLVNAYAALLQLPLNAFPGDQRSAVLAGEQPTREGMVDLARLSVSANRPPLDPERMRCLEKSCGCRLKVKARWRSETCPLGKWPSA